MAAKQARFNWIMGSKALFGRGKFSPFLHLFYKIKLIHVKFIYDSCEESLSQMDPKNLCVGFSLSSLESIMFGWVWD